MAIVGGTGTILGPFLGSGIVLVCATGSAASSNITRRCIGVVFIVTVLWAPQGIVGWSRAGARGTKAGTAPP